MLIIKIVWQKPGEDPVHEYHDLTIIEAIVRINNLTLKEGPIRIREVHVKRQPLIGSMMRQIEGLSNLCKAANVPHLMLK